MTFVCAAGEAHLNANVPLFLQQKGKLMSWSVNVTLARDMTLMTAHRGRGAFQQLRAHSMQDGQIGSIRVCSQAQTQP